MEYSEEGIRNAEEGLKHLVNQIKELRIKNYKLRIKNVDKNYKNKFLEVVNDDLNMPQALAIVQEVLKSKLGQEEKLATILDFNKVLGLDLGIQAEVQKDLSIEVKELIKLRDSARVEKNWEESDKIRDKIEKLGYIIEDSKNGMRVFKK
jgi:cysteinyl-tRNA synthetase